MKIILGSANRAVVKRWAGHLNDAHRLAQALSVKELQAMSTRGWFDLALVHRSLIDRETLSTMLTEAPTIKFFLLSDRPDENEGLAFVKRGIVGYANTYISRARLLAAIRTIENGSVWVGQKVIQLLIAEAHGRTKASCADLEQKKQIEGLTGREQEIAQHVAVGRSNLEIAAALNITERTVKAHLTSIYEKTQTANRLGLALLINKG